MRRYSSISLTLFSLLCVFTCYPTVTSQDEGICDLIYCGEGSCKLTSSFPFFECDCFPGWNKIQIGPLPFAACLLPNCTLNQQCGNGSLPPPPPSVPLPPPPINLTDPCNIVWCAEGSCIPNGTIGHICECNEGAANLINNTDLPCFQSCFLGADCTNLGLLPPPPPSPPNSGWRMINSRKNLGVLITFIWLTLI
ncbi:uncharacterized protein [Euphorbia lathyris]|uniref:uncharacterized protein isoform X2 n=1 Tax=Euphorbia lathyris TaxID=212925 RepID=UPI003313195C